MASLLVFVWSSLFIHSATPFLLETADDDANSNTVSISSSCVDKPIDGLYYIKPTVDGAIIPVICSGGYTMLDASLNFDAMSTYFTSIYRYGDDDKALYGTDCSESSGWRDWFIPANKNTKFRIAQGCGTCIDGDFHGDNTAYYMTNDYFCPVGLDGAGCSASNAKDMVLDSFPPDETCNICDDAMGLCGEGAGRTGQHVHDLKSAAWCDCYSLQLTADHRTTSDHSSYCKDGLNWRPSFVTDRSQCTCFKQMDEEITKYNVQMDDLPLVSTDYQKDIEEVWALHVDDNIVWEEATKSMSRSDCAEVSVYLSQKDFEDGTFRITECGNYILTEDILVNFGAPLEEFNYARGDSPNAYHGDELPWFPTNEQQNNGQYFGLNAFWGPYSLGFFAAISIETHYVEINLNGFSIAMDEIYYLQQRFFAIIELGNKQFEATQGPVDFGRDDLCLKWITIRDGTLGLSSHQGIHGSCSQHVEINNLEIKNFDVAGIHCNGCKHMNIENCLIGPQNVNIPVKGRYLHGRIMLSRLRYFVDEYGDAPIQFANREEGTTVRALADRLIDQMDMVYYHITQGIQFDDDNEEWVVAKQTFLNPTGWLDGGSSYGILLNGFGTAVVNIGRRTEETEDISITDVEIKDIKVKPYENYWASTWDVSDAANEDRTSVIVHGFFFETIDWNEGNVIDFDTGLYLGDAYTDILFAANSFLHDDFCPLGSLFYLDGLQEWAMTDGTSAFNDEIGLDFRCGSDIQSHSAKGAMGIRIDGVKEFVIDNVNIHDIANWGDLGTDACGEYVEVEFISGFDVDKDIQYGYTGDNVHGILTDYATGSINNLRMTNLESLHGSTIGVALYKGSEVELSGDIAMNQMVAGSALSEDESNALILPNAPPFVCSIFIGPNSESDSLPELTPSVTTSDDLSAVANGLYGYDFCGEEARVGSMGSVILPENIVSNKEEERLEAVSINDGNFLFHSFSSKFYLIIGASILLSGLMFALIKMNNHRLDGMKRRKLTKTTTTYGTASVNVDNE